jgi:hypothetical protein
MSTEKRGPPLPIAAPDGKGTKAVTLSLTPMDYQIITKAAARTGLPVAAFMLAAARADAGWTVHCGVHARGGPSRRRKNSAKNKLVGNPFLSTRCRSILLIHVQGHACHNDAGFTDEALLRAILDKTCVELLQMRGVGKHKLVEFYRHLGEHGLALKCGCPQTPCLEYMKRNTGEADADRPTGSVT